MRRKIAGEPFLGDVLTERECRLAEGENGGLLMRGKGCWRLGGSVKVLAEKGGGAMTAVMERESGAGCPLVGREDREFVFS